MPVQKEESITVCVDQTSKMRNRQARDSHLTRCQSPSPDLIFSLWPREKAIFTSPLKCCNWMTRFFFTWTQNSNDSKVVSTLCCPVGLPRTIPAGSPDPEGQRPNQKVWRRLKTWVAHQSGSNPLGRLNGVPTPFLTAPSWGQDVHVPTRCFANMPPIHIKYNFQTN